MAEVLYDLSNKTCGASLAADFFFNKYRDNPKYRNSNQLAADAAKHYRDKAEKLLNDFVKDIMDDAQYLEALSTVIQELQAQRRDAEDQILAISSSRTVLSNMRRENQHSADVHTMASRWYLECLETIQR